MYVRRRESEWVALAPAKLNLYLDVLGRRDDDYHEVETLLVPVRLFDTIGLTATPSGSGGSAGPIELTVSQSVAARHPTTLVDGPANLTSDQSMLPADSRNLIVAALQHLQDASGCTRGADIRLFKRIPLASGLGGGSSDAAAALVLANAAWRLHWSRERLATVAASIGSDVPFFLTGGPAICRGRGEQTTALAGITPLRFVIARPPVSLATADVFREWDCGSTTAHQRQDAGDLPQLIDALRQGITGRLHWFMCNRLQSAAERISSWIGRLADAFDDLELIGHQLTGSGSAYFGICHTARQASHVASRLRAQRLGVVYATGSCH